MKGGHMVKSKKSTKSLHPNTYPRSWRIRNTSPHSWLMRNVPLLTAGSCLLGNTYPRSWHMRIAQYLSSQLAHAQCTSPHSWRSAISAWGMSWRSSLLVPRPACPRPRSQCTAAASCRVRHTRQIIIFKKIEDLFKIQIIKMKLCKLWLF